MRLFGIDAIDIEDVYSNPVSRSEEGDLLKMRGRPSRKHGSMPLQIVIDPHTDPPTVISVYPYKSRRRKT